MHPAAEVAAAKITGKMRVTVGIGRKGYTGEFEPYGTAYADADVLQQDGKWVVTCPRVVVGFTHHSPRKITGVGVLILDHWFYDPLDNEPSRPLEQGDTIFVGFTHDLPEAI